MKTCKSTLCVPGLVLLCIVAATAADGPLTFTFKKANVPGALQTTPGGINNAGISVGQYEDSSSVFHGYMLKGKTVTTLDDPNVTMPAGSSIAT